MTEPDDDDFRFVEAPDGWVLQVAVIVWDSPHTPTLSWSDFRKWRHEPDAGRRAQAKAAALKRYFRTCIHCGELCLRGHMHSHDTCQGCAERLLGVIY